MVSRKEVFIKTIELVKNWPSALAAYPVSIVLRKNFLTLYELNDGTKYYLNVRGPDRALLIQIWKYRVYTRLFDVQKDDIIVDLGAHIGIFTIYAAMKCKRVVAVEPTSTNFEILEKNISVNKLTNVKALKLAIWDSRKDGDIYISESTSAGNSAFLKSDRKEKVKFVTIKDILDMERLRTVDFMKIDIEGCESDAILATPKETLLRVKKFAIEC